MSETLPLILLSGMGAGPRLLEAQRAALESVRLADWIAALPGETLPEYARRMARIVDPGGPCLVGGVSMGGMVALEMAPHLQARACVLISSIRSADQLPRRWRAFRPLAHIVPRCCGQFPRAIVAAWLTVAGRWLRPVTRSLLEEFVQTDGRFLLWSIEAVLSWKPTPQRSDIPIAQIHGDRDFLLPHRLTQPEVLVPGAGHLLPVTHPEAVIDFLQRQLEKYGGLVIRRRRGGSRGPGGRGGRPLPGRG